MFAGALTLLTLAACGSDDLLPDEEVGEGEVAMQISGAVEGSFSGTASLTVLGPESVVGIGITLDDGAGTVNFTGLTGGPRTGTFPVGGAGDGTNFQGTVLLDAINDVSIGSGGFANLNGGSLTITSADDRSVEGQFTSTGQTLGDTQAEITVSGSFEAVCRLGAVCP